MWFATQQHAQYGEKMTDVTVNGKEPVPLFIKGNPNTSTRAISQQFGICQSAYPENLSTSAGIEPTTLGLRGGHAIFKPLSNIQSDQCGRGF
ncbi:hypothetical protein TNCV_741281 [Trichonephila clavipes]|nr:hypothetical protein TNCV_741281 [Trichonephila clavipes]